MSVVCLTFDRSSGFSETAVCAACGDWQEEGEEYQVLVIGGEPCPLCPICYRAATSIEVISR